MSQTPETSGNLYKATPKVAGVPWIIIASCITEARKQLGDSANQFTVRGIDGKRKRPRGRTAGTYYPVPVKLCPYQYGECCIPVGGECYVKPNAPDMQEWVKRATEAHLCAHVGISITREDYEKRQKWVLLQDAIKEFARK